MKSVFAALLFGLIASASAPPPADACGVKLTIKGSAHKKGISRTTNPSDVLLVGSPPRRLSRDLSSAGHRVEVAPNVESAKRQNYSVVIADNAQADAARQKWPNAVVMTRSGDVTADMRTVEKNVARKPVDAVASREPVRTSETRPPIAAGPIQPKREIVANAEANQPVETKAEPKPVETKVEPKPVETTAKVEPKRVETKVEPKAEPKPEPAEVASKPAEPVKPAVTPKTVSRSGSEVYFALAKEQADEAALKKVVKWLKDSPDINVTVEGHADPSGNHDSNMTLSQHRAEWVRDALVAAGVDSSRIEVKAFGDTQLKYGAKDRRNRRVQITAR